MTVRTRMAGLMVAIASLTPAAAPAQPAPDAPQWAQPGGFGVGVRELPLPVGAVDDVDAWARGESEPPRVNRQRSVRLWYPAAATASNASGTLSRTLKDHPWRGWATPTVTARSPSRAQADAPPATGTARWPVVVFSHGLLNWAELMADLAEHLASHGHVVVAVQHEDEAHADPLRAALAFRPVDLRAARALVERLQVSGSDPLSGRIDLQRQAVVGYSMGGYGALVSAGARVPADSMAARYVPGRAMQAHAEAPTATEAGGTAVWQAVVAIAPWGGQRQFGALAAEGLRPVRSPTLLVAGDQDDISGYSDGVRAVWEGLSAAPRWLLTFEGARHNIGHLGWVDGLPRQFRTWEAFEEPVWRRDRLLQVQRHAVLAFLARHLQSVPGAGAALDVPTVRASDGAWQVPWGTPASGAFAAAGGPGAGYWPGFQRRWAVGLRLEHLGAGAAAGAGRSP